MTAADCFYDTSVLLYLLSADARKADRVEELLALQGAISVQVLNEFASVGTRKLGLSFPEIRELLDTLRSVCETHSMTLAHHDKGLEIAERYRFSIYDSLIVAAALLSGCKTLYSEDLQHRQVIEGQLTIVNPFARA